MKYLSSFNESNKFFQMKDIIDDIKDISLDLVDNGFDVEVQPSVDTQIALASLRTNRVPFYIRVTKPNTNRWLMKFNFGEVSEVFERIAEYVQSKGILDEITTSNQSTPNHQSVIVWAKLEFIFKKNEVFEGLKSKNNWYDYLRTVSFEELPYEYQKSLMIYMYEGDAVDWSISVSRDKVAKDDKLIKILINDYISVGRNRHKSFAYGVIPMDVLTREVTDRLGWDSFEEYHKWYIKDNQVERHKEIYPIILDPDNDELIEDGWHRFHHYYRSGVKNVPAVCFI